MVINNYLLLQMLGFGSSNAFGILFNNFFLEQDGASGLPLVIGVYNGALSISGNKNIFLFIYCEF